MIPAVRTLNLSRPPVDRGRALLEYLWHQPEEVLVLTETAVGGGSDLLASVCRAAGHQVHSSLHDRDGRRRPGVDGKSLGVLGIGRDAGLERLELPLPGACSERVLVTRLLPSDDAGETGAVRLIAVYGAASDPVRYATAVQRQRKRDWLVGFLTWLSGLPPEPTLFVGDLNIAAPGHLDKLPYVLAEERTAYDILTGGLDYRDCVAADGTTADLRAEPTWVDHTGVGCRYDHVLASAEVPPGECVIDHGPRESGLSDHAALAWAPIGD